MNDQPNPTGLEAIDSVTTELPAISRTLPAGMRVNIRGRSIKLRGLKRQPKGLWRWLLILGPGLIATSAGNDAGGIATYSSAGAQFGYKLIWVMLVLTVSFAVVQEMCARLGAATGRGLLDLIRERFGIGWTLFVVCIVIIANGGVTLSEFVGIGAASELFGVSRYIYRPNRRGSALVSGNLRLLREGRENFSIDDACLFRLSNRGFYGSFRLERGRRRRVRSDD